jgi:pimeloyl-ACP methyl ester carboxylesterase
MSINAISDHSHTSNGHTTFYFAAGPEDGPLVVFIHGWPEQSISWRHQLPSIASLGFRAVAPDMRGYGGSTVYSRHEDYAQENVVSDMLRLLDGLGREKAVWVGHDWGSPTVWGLASHHPERCVGVANLCVPYYVLDHGLDAALEYIDRDVYPEDEFPAGQWEYMFFYQENFENAVAPLQANPYNTVKALFLKGDPAGQGKPSRTAYVRKQGGWFGGAAEAPDVPRDADVVSEEDLRAYSDALSRNGFFGPCSYYMNHGTNRTYAAKAVNDGYLDMPVLFLHGLFDYTCETVQSRLAEPMRTYCRNLCERTIKSGHWMAQERPREVNAALVEWMATCVPDHWPR